MYIVLQEVKKPAKCFYTIADARTRRVVGSARVDYTKGKSFWTYKTKSGARITNKQEQKAMSDAVTRFFETSK
jgi:hypothetical protein